MTELYQAMLVIIDLYLIMKPNIELKLDQNVHLRKPHPCGGYKWQIVRLGADIGLRCLTCQRRVLMSRRALAKQIKSIEK